MKRLRAHLRPLKATPGHCKLRGRAVLVRLGSPATRTIRDEYGPWDRHATTTAMPAKRMTSHDLCSTVHQLYASAHPKPRLAPVLSCQAKRSMLDLHNQVSQSFQTAGLLLALREQAVGLACTGVSAGCEALSLPFPLWIPSWPSGPHLICRKTEIRPCTNRDE